MVLKKINPIFLFFLLASMATFFSCKSKKPDPVIKKDAPIVVDVLIATAQNIDNIIEANGAIIANNFVQIKSEVNGRITSLNIPEGRHVSKGTILARLNDADLQAQLSKLKVQLDLNKKTEQRLRTLLAANGVNQADYDVSLSNINSNKADIQFTQALINKTIIKAPFDGTIGLRQVSVGAIITSADVIASLQDVNKNKIDFTLPEEYSKIIKVGNIIDVQLDAVNDKKIKAKIIATEPQINQNSRNVIVRAQLDEGNVNIGSFVKAFINAGENKTAFMVPTNALILDDKNNQVILVKNNKASFVNVKIGIRKSNSVEILSGINAGDSVIVTGLLFVKPKADLKVRSQKTLQQIEEINNNTPEK